MASPEPRRSPAATGPAPRRAWAGAASVGSAGSGSPRGRRVTVRPPRRGVDEDEFHAWLQHFTERSEPLMTWLGVVFALLVAAQLGLPLHPLEQHVLGVSVWVIWAVFAVDFLLKFWLAPHRLHFLRSHWLPLLGLMLPTLRVLSFARLLRLGRALPAARVLTSSSRAAGTAGHLFRSRIGYLAGLGSLGILVVAELGYVFESGPHGALPSFKASAFWAAACVVGQSPTVNPATTGGQLAMLTGFALGLITISTLAGSVGAYLLDPRHGGVAGVPPTDSVSPASSPSADSAPSALDGDSGRG